MNLNIVHLVGRVGKDPEVRYFESGNLRCRFTLAVRRRSSKSDQPDWFSREISGKPAEIAQTYVRKGSLIGVKGSLKIDKWTDRHTGVNRSTPVINVEQLYLLGSKADNNPNVRDNYGR